MITTKHITRQLSTVLSAVAVPTRTVATWENSRDIKRVKIITLKVARAFQLKARFGK